jgi:hypothetical protein
MPHPTDRTFLGKALWFCGLCLAYVALFALGTTLFPLKLEPSADPNQAGAALGGLFACALIDTSLLILWASRTRLRGFRRAAALTVALYGVKTFTSQLEALWFMPNVTGPMAPALFGMTLPLALLYPALVAKAFGSKAQPEEPVWRKPAASRGALALAWSVLSIFVYPTLFFTAGYFIAFQSAAVREFYGGALGDSFFSHMAGLLRTAPSIFPFEAFRGFLWILMMLPLIRTSTRAWLSDAVLTGAFLALVQNDVHLIPNPLMAPEIRLYHFIETASSNFVWGFLIVFGLRGWFERRRTSSAVAIQGRETP